MRILQYASSRRINILFWVGVTLISGFTSVKSFAQSSSVGIGTTTPSPRAVLQLVVEDQNGSPQGFLAPVVQTISQRDNIGPTAGEAGMIVYVSETNLFYFWNGTQWIEGLGVFAGSIAGGDLTGTYPNPGLGTDVVTNVQLAPFAVTNENISPGAVNSTSIENGSIVSQDIGDNSITSADILDGTISNTDLAPGSVQTPQIADGSIQSQDIGDDQVTLNKIENGGPDQVLTTDPSGNPRYEDRSNFQSSSLPTGNIFIGNGGNVATPNPVTGDISLSVTGDAQLGADVVGTNELAPNAVTTNEIAAGAVETSDLAVSAVNSSIIEDLSIQLNDIGDDQVGLTKIVNAPAGVRNFLVTDAATGEPEYRTQAEVLQGFAGDGLIENGSGELDVNVDNLTLNIDSDVLEIADGGVNTQQLADDAVNSAKILDASITPNDIRGNFDDSAPRTAAMLITNTNDFNGDNFVDVDWLPVGADRVIVTDPVTGEFTSEPRGNFDQLVLAPGEIFVGSPGLTPTPTAVGDGNIMIGVGTNITFQPVSGDITLGSSGLATIQDGAVQGNDLDASVAAQGVTYDAIDSRIELGGDLSESATINLTGGNALTVQNSAGGTFSVSTGATAVTVDGSSNLDVDGTLNVDGNSTLNNTFVNSSIGSSSPTTGALRVTGGVGIGENLNIAGEAEVESTTNSTSPASGALRVAGGTGIAGNTFVGGNFNANGNTFLNGQVDLGNAPEDLLTFEGDIINRAGGDAMVFEGSIDNDNQTIIRFTEPTNDDNIISFPDASGTVALTSGGALAPDLALTTDNSGRVVVADDAQVFNVNSDDVNLGNSASDNITLTGATDFQDGNVTVSNSVPQTSLNSSRTDITGNDINIGNGAGDDLDFIGVSDFNSGNFTVNNTSPATSLNSPETNITGADINIGNDASDQTDFTGNVDFNNGLDVDAGDINVNDGVNLIFGDGTVTTGTGQINFGGNVNANNGVDVSNTLQAFDDVILGSDGADVVTVNGTASFNNSVVTFNNGAAVTGGALQLSSGTSVNRIVSSTDGFTPSDNELATTQAIQDVVNGISLDDGSGITVDNLNNEIDLGGTLDQTANIITGAGFNVQISGAGQLDVDTDADFSGTTTLSSADINSGTLDNTIIGAVVSAAATVTDLTATGTVDLGTDAIQSAEIEDNQVTLTKIVDGGANQLLATDGTGNPVYIDQSSVTVGTASDLVAAGSVVSDPEVDNDLTIDGGVIDNTVIGGVTAAAATVTDLTATGTVDLGTDAIQSAEIEDNQVTLTKIVDGGANQLLATDGTGNPVYIDQSSVTVGTASDLVAAGSVVSDPEVDNDLTIDGGVIDNTVIGGVTAAAATVTDLTATGTVDLGTDAIQSAEIEDNQVTLTKIVDGGANQLLATDGTGNPVYIDQSSVTVGTASDLVAAGSVVSDPEVDNDLTIDGGVIDNTVIGGVTAAAATVTDLTATGTVDLGTDAIQSAEIEDNQVTLTKIVDGGANQLLATDGTGNPVYIDQSSVTVGTASDLVAAGSVVSDPEVDNDLTIDGGVIDNTVIGGVTAAAATVTDLTATGTVDLGTDAIQSAEIEDNQVTLTKIVDGGANQLLATDGTGNPVYIDQSSVTVGTASDLVAAGSVVSDPEVDNDLTIDGGVIDNTVIGGVTAAAATVTDLTATGTVDLGTDAIQSAEIEDNQVTLTKIVDGGANQLLATDGTGNPVYIDQSSVTVGTASDLVAAGSVVSDPEVDNDLTIDGGVIDNTVIGGVTAAAATVTDLTATGTVDLGTDAIQSAEIADGAVIGGTGGDILDNSITAADIGVGAVNSSEIFDGGVTTDDIATGAVTETELNVSVSGNGLTGGGGTPLSVGAGTGITVNADDIEVDESALDLANLGGVLGANQVSGGTVVNSEFDQLGTLGATTISAANWGHLSNMDQNVGSTSSVTFQGISVMNLAGAAGTYTNDALSQSFIISAAGAFSSSDIRLKENIENLDSPLDKIKNTEGVRYNFKSDNKDQVHFGVIAQDIEKIFPNLVRTDERGYKSVNYTELIPVLIEALKEQQLLIESLQAKLDDEKSSKEDLRSALDDQQKLVKLQASAMLALQQENNEMKSDINKIKKAIGLELEASDR